MVWHDQEPANTIEHKNNIRVLGLSLSLKDLRVVDEKQIKLRKHKRSNSRKISTDDINSLFNVFLYQKQYFL